MSGQQNNATDADKGCPERYQHHSRSLIAAATARWMDSCAWRAAHQSRISCDGQSGHGPPSSGHPQHSLAAIAAGSGVSVMARHPSI
jgi:hypothetical protein